MSSEKKPSTQNILTAVVAGVALVLALVVILIKTGVFEKKDKEPDTVVESSVVLASQTMENGEVVYYTMVDYYVRPRVSSFYVYPTTTPPPTSAPESTVSYIEETEVVEVTDEDGYLLVDENGVPLTQVVVHTIPVTEAPSGEITTAYIPRTEGMAVTDKLHRVKKDENGNPITEIVTLDPYPTEAPASGEESTTASKDKKKNDASKEDALASGIITQINSNREANGLERLSTSSDLKALASTKCMSMIFPDLYGKISLPSASYTMTTDYGGSSLCDSAASQAEGSALSDSVSEVGTAVIRYKGTYYTAVLFK